ncbi:MAG: hypothetical protein AB7I18_14465 [Candidatus Berkiella sp.]
MLNGPLVEEVLDNGDTVALPVVNAPVAKDDALIVAKKEEALALVPANFDCVVSHNVVMKTAAAATFVGTHAGGLLARAAAPEIAERVSERVKEAVKKTGDEMTKAMLKETGLDKIPGAQLLMGAEVTDLAQKASVEAYNQTVTTVTKKGAVVGGTLAGGVTIIALETLNALGYGYNQYIAPMFEHRRQQALALESQRISQHAMKDSGLVVDETDEEELRDFVVLKLK